MANSAQSAVFMCYVTHSSFKISESTVAFSDLELASIKRSAAAYTKKYGPPAHVQKQLSWDWVIDKQCVLLCEVRPHWQDANKLLKNECVKTTFVRTKNIWQIYWMRADLKWHSYEPSFVVNSFDDFLNVLQADEHGCFFG